MNRIAAASEKAVRVLALAERLQSRFVQALESFCEQSFFVRTWRRDGGRHGGGKRYEMADSQLIGRASINTSQVHYEDESDRELSSASAFSAIVHPTPPQAPSVHIHISWTEKKNGGCYWRIMADLNPALPNLKDKAHFLEALKQAAPIQFNEAVEQGVRYFFIPAVGRCRGIAHFYLENYSTGVFDGDMRFARKTGEAAIGVYTTILKAAARHAEASSRKEKAVQLAYYTLYFFQVLTLDRGTTAGLLAHNQNDIGILGSLPPRIDKNFLVSWRPYMTPPQDLLLDQLLAVFPNERICIIDVSLKYKLAEAIRAHYRKFPKALELQASR